MLGAELQVKFVCQACRSTEKTQRDSKAARALEVKATSVPYVNHLCKQLCVKSLHFPDPQVWNVDPAGCMAFVHAQSKNCECKVEFPPQDYQTVIGSLQVKYPESLDPAVFFTRVLDNLKECGHWGTFWLCPDSTDGTVTIFSKTCRDLTTRNTPPALLLPCGANAQQTQKLLEHSNRKSSALEFLAHALEKLLPNVITTTSYPVSDVDAKGLFRFNCIPHVDGVTKYTALVAIGESEEFPIVVYRNKHDKDAVTPLMLEFADYAAFNNWMAGKGSHIIRPNVVYKVEWLGCK